MSPSNSFSLSPNPATHLNNHPVGLRIYSDSDMTDSPDMAEDLPQFGQYDPCAKARQILDGISHYRIDPSIIGVTDAPSAKGSRGVVVAAKFIVPETRPAPTLPTGVWTTPTLFPGAWAAPFLEVKLAVKKLEWSRDDAEESTKFFKSLVNELSIMATLSHPNIVHLVGFVEDMQKRDAWIIVPWEENGNVRDFLQSGEWDIPERVSLVQDVASGLEYLHTRQPPICHGDLKSPNILVNSSYRAVITDFGAARIKKSIATAKENQLVAPHQIQLNVGDVKEAAKLTPSDVELDATTLDLTLTAPKYTLRWAAPEVLSDHEQDLPSDMWCIGWICWEIVTGRIPFEEIHLESHVITRIIAGRLPALRGNKYLSHVLQLCSLMSECWLPDLAQRIVVSTFGRKLRFVPSSTPSNDTFGGAKVRPVALLLELGRMYSLQNNTAQAEEYYRSALHSATRTADDTAKADALIGLGGICNARSRYQDAEKAFGEAHEIHSRIANDPGIANALVGLGESYSGRSRYQDAEEALGEARGIHSRIGNDLGAANALVGLGESYNARSRYRDSETAFNASHEIYSRIGNDLGAANALVGLGESYNARSRHQEAEKAFKEAYEIHSRVGNDLGAANALAGLGESYHAWSRYQDSEEAFNASHEIYSRIGNDLGAANALVGLGESYNARSRHQDAKKAFKEAYEIYSQIGNNLGAANALVGRGECYNTQSRYQDAEKAFTASQEIHSRIGNDLGVANALVGLGESYNALSRHQEAEEAFMEAYLTHARIDNALGAANALMGLGEVYTAQLRYKEAKPAFKKAHEIYSWSGCQVGLVRAGILLYETYNTLLDYPEADNAFKGASEILSRLENEISPQNAPYHPEEDCDTQSIYSGDEEGKEDHCHTEQNGKEANAPEEDPESFPMVPVADTQPNSMRQKQDLSEELTAIAHAPVPATRELIDLLHALGKAAPKAVRNKHKIYSILRGSRDMCNHIMEIGDSRERQSHPDIKAVLTRTEDYFALLDALEETLLQLAAILPSDITAFGADSYSSWPHSRSTLAGILTNLSRPPFSTISSHVQDIPDDLFLDDCSWLSRLLYRGIHPEISTQFLDAPKTHPVFVVIKGLEYLETQVKCGVPDEPTRELIIDIATLLARTLASTSPDDGDKSLQENNSLATETDRDWLFQALAGSFSILDLESTLQPSIAKELANKWTDIKIGLASRGPNVPEN